MRLISRPWTILLVALASLCSVAAGQGLRAEARLSPSSVPVGLPAELSIVVEGTLAAQEPVPPRVEGLEITYVGTSRRPAPTIIINNQPVDGGPDSVSFTFRITPLIEGTFEIPAIDVLAAGQRLRTQPATLTVREAEDPVDQELVLEIPRRVAWVGEPVRMRLTWIIGGDVRGYEEFAGPRPSEDLKISTPQDNAWLKDASGVFEVPFLGQSARAAIRRADPDHGGLDTLTIEQILVAHQKGTFNLGPFSAVYEALRADGSGRLRPTRGVVRSEMVTLEVKPLPEMGRPAGFNGLVGRSSLFVEASERDLSVGDPITLSLTIRTDEPVDRVIPPDLASSPGFQTAFRLDSGGWQLRRGDATTRTYTTLIRPRSADVAEIPAIELPYFDPETQSYQIARTEPIAITVASVGEVTIADATIAPSAEALSAREAKPLEDRLSGVLANHATTGALIDESARPLYRLDTPEGVVVVMAPPGLFALAWMGATARRRVRSAPHRRRAALARARRALRARGDAAVRARDAIRIYVANRFDLAPVAVTPADCRVRLESLGEGALGADLQRMLERVESATFEPDAPAWSGSPREVLSLLHEVDNATRRTHA
ncbi:MAG: BatD family protein [Phycisphaeraceae bacterium]|nr:BatD family protein [Phycisphaeraceae bacterium]